MKRDFNPRSRFFSIQDPGSGSRCQKSTGSRIRNTEKIWHYKTIHFSAKIICPPKISKNSPENYKQFKTIKKPKCQECVGDFVIITKKENFVWTLAWRFFSSLTVTAQSWQRMCRRFTHSSEEVVFDISSGNLFKAASWKFLNFKGTQGTNYASLCSLADPVRQTYSY